MILITAGQALAIILFFAVKNYQDPRPRFKNVRLGLLFLCVHVGIQSFLHGHLTVFYQISPSALTKFLITMCYYMIFVFLWSGASFSVCMMMAALFDMIDNCLWPMLSIVSEWLWSHYTFSPSFFHFLPIIFLFWLLECGLLYLIHRLLPSMKKIHLKAYNVILLFLSIFPFMYFRIFSSQFSFSYSQPTQIIMTLYSLLMMIVLVDSIGHTSIEFENQLSAKLQDALQIQKQQFQKKLQDIDTVNQKYHDMKNILLYLENQHGTESAQQQIKKMMEELHPYETLVNTGNDTIDLILSEKLSVCHQKQISCVPYLDGSMLNFISPLDLCIIFGNALDNAMESCEQIPFKEDRHISIKTVKKDTSVLLIFRNTFAAPPLLKDGFPVTSKSNRQEHGYGFKNICCTAEKYRGNVSCRIEGQEFILSLLFV